MDEKTEQLRDLFMEVADDETVTDRQVESRGSLATDEQSVDERLRSVIEEMRDQFEFDTDWSTETYQDLVRRFYDGDDDAAIAETLGTDAVFRGRMDLQLVRNDDPPGVDTAHLETIRDRQDEGVSSIANSLELDETAVERALAVIEARDRARRVSHRFTTAFEEILTDSDLTVRFATDAHESGLEDATEGAEVDVDF